MHVMFGAGNLFAPKDKAADQAKYKAVTQVREWLEEMLPEEERSEHLGGKAASGNETNVIVNQLACKEEGCPDVELVIRLIYPKPRLKLSFKIYKAAIDMSREELEAAVQQAKAKEESEAAVNGAESEHGGDCCDGDHP